jgi:thiol-disulfide isomerase/thioredoxin
MRPTFAALVMIALVLAGCAAPGTSQPGASVAGGTVPSAEPRSFPVSDPPVTPPADASEPPASPSGAPASPSDVPVSPSDVPVSPSPATAAADPLLSCELVDVRTGTPFTLGGLAAEKPVLIETMAIWCTTCRAQQREVVVAHRSADFHSVGIDVDPNERAQDLAEYAEREGFDWRFAVADPQLVHLLTERYGFGVTNPPSTPTFVVSPGGAVRALEFGRVRSADELVTELAAR